MSRTLDLTRELVARPSITPNDAGCQQLIAERLIPLGFDVEWHYCGAVSNVLFTRGRGAPSFWFLGHTDVVPVEGQDWHYAPFRMQENDGRLYGRGTTDMKGFVACATSAAGWGRRPSF